jgi:Cof subfamily protein (haloacid dehalogenase superfamily)
LSLIFFVTQVIILNIELVVADIDGTFLDSEGKSSQGALEAIQAIRNQGIRFTLCSGRGNPGVKPFIDLLKLKQPYIISGGAAIIDPLSQSIIRQEIMSERQVHKAVQLGMQSGSDMLFHNAWQLYVLSTDEFWEDIKSWEWMKGYGWQDFRRIRTWQEAPIHQIIRMDYFNLPERLHHLAEEVEKLNENLHAIVMRRNIEISDKRVEKGSALAHLAEYLNIPLENVMSLGDGLNDISMLETAGVGVAMKNSSPEVIEKADYLAPGCDEGGLATVLNHLMAGTLGELKLALMEYSSEKPSII